MVLPAPLIEVIKPHLMALATRILEHVYEQSGAKAWVTQRLGGTPDEQALARVLDHAIVEFAACHPMWLGRLFGSPTALTPELFEVASAPVLAQFLLRDGHPDPDTLARTWAANSDRADVAERARLIAEVTPVAVDFLEIFAHAFRQEAHFAPLNDSRAFEHIDARLQELLEAHGAGRATPATHRNYLAWMRDRNRYLDNRGLMQVQRQVQVPLTEVYVSLAAAREDELAPSDRRHRDAELADLAAKQASGQLTAEESETLRDQIIGHFSSTYRPGEIIDVASVVDAFHHLVVLGDPGGGKTTFLRYLAYQHAEAVLRGHAEAGGLGRARFPIFVRIAEYVDGGYLDRLPLSDYLAEYCRQHECPHSGVVDLLRDRLGRGGCLVLLDGLDEIVDADDRRRIIPRIEEFVRRHDHDDNRFVITSRVAGYRNNPLGARFTHFLIQDMDGAQVGRFLERWCRAVEDAQTPDIAPNLRAANAQREVKGILDALQASPSVRRLATNPLLLTALALIHRTGAQLPQKRAGLYRLAADTLGRNWRLAQGVQSEALVNEEDLTDLLSAMAHWLHGNKSSGLATHDEVHEVLDAAWATLDGVNWDPVRPDRAVRHKVESFLSAVRQHTGLFVERAPGLYGFMHLTFEEYYAARYLIADSDESPALIRSYLHDPRWREPILLALGLLSIDWRRNAQKMVETAILARGDKARQLHFVPSEYEELLGRDFLFACRCLADQISVEANLHHELILRMVEEAVLRRGLGRFSAYWSAMRDRLLSLAGSESAPIVARHLARLAKESDKEVRAAIGLILGGWEAHLPLEVTTMVRLLADPERDVVVAAQEMIGMWPPSDPELVAVLISMTDDGDARTRAAAAIALRNAVLRGNSEALAALITLSGDSDEGVRGAVAETLRLSEEAPPEVIAALLRLLADPSAQVRDTAKTRLRWANWPSDEVPSQLAQLLEHPDPNVQVSALEVLARFRVPQADVFAAVVDLVTAHDGAIRSAAACTIAAWGPQSAHALANLQELLQNSNSETYLSLLKGIERDETSRPEIVASLLGRLTDRDATVRAATADKLRWLKVQKPEVGIGLAELLDDPRTDVRLAAVWALQKYDSPGARAVSDMAMLVNDPDSRLRAQATDALGRWVRDPSTLLPAMMRLITDPDDHVRRSAIATLGQWSRLKADAAATFAGLLTIANDDVRIDAIQLIGVGRATIPDTTQALLRLLEDANAMVRIQAAIAIGRIKPREPACAVAVAHLLADPVAKVRTTAVRVLGWLKSTGSKVRAIVADLLEHPDAGVRATAVTTMGKLWPQSGEAITSFQQLVTDADVSVRVIAAHLLGETGDSSVQTMALLRRGLVEATDITLRIACAEVLGKVAPATEENLECLGRSIPTSERKLSEACIEALDAIARRSPSSKPAVTRLIANIIGDSSDADDLDDGFIGRAHWLLWKLYMGDDRDG